MQIAKIIYPVRDVAAGTAVFRALLGIDPHTEQPYYVGFNTDGLEVGLVPGGFDQGMTGPVSYFGVDDVKSSIEAMVAAGAAVKDQPNDFGAGQGFVASVVDVDGNVIGLADTQPPA